jgi:hypothetical protein
MAQPACLQELSFPVRFDVSKSHGRRLLASQDIKAGTVILQSEAVAAVVPDTYVDSVCHKCFSESAETLYVCSGCMFARFCSVQCMNHAKVEHAFECAALGRLQAELKDQEDDTPLHGTPVRLVLRMLALKKIEEYEQQLREKLRASTRSGKVNNKAPPKSKYVDCLELVSNLSQVDAEEMKILEQFVKDLKPILGEEVWPADDKEVLEHFMRVQCNAHTVSRPSEKAVIGIGVFPAACYLNHSCVPNCVYSCVPSTGDRKLPVVEFRAIRDVQQGEELCYSYVDLYQPREARRSQLEKAYLFRCDCARCAGRDATVDSLVCPCGGTERDNSGSCVKCTQNVDEKSLFEQVSMVLTIAAGPDHAVALRSLKELKASDEFKLLSRDHYLRLNVNLAIIHCAQQENEWDLVKSTAQECLDILNEFASSIDLDMSNFPEIGSLKLAIGESLMKVDDKEEALNSLKGALGNFMISMGKESENYKKCMNLLDTLEPKQKTSKKSKGKKGKKH